MPPESSVREMRRGTKSCLECRKRKIKCIWRTDSHIVCRNCEQRGRACQPQTALHKDHATLRLSSRDRIAQLEDSTSRLWAAVRNIQANTNLPMDEAPNRFDLSTPEAADADSDASESVPISPPPHLKQLFENDTLGSNEYPSPGTSRASSGSAEHRIGQVRRALQQLLPTREDVRLISSYASGWLSLYNDLFPTSHVLKTGSQLLDQQELVRHPKASPFVISAYLLSLAITLQQMPTHALHGMSGNIQDGVTFIRDVTNTVAATIFHNDALAASIEGIDVSLLYLRLHLGGNKMRINKLWLGIRRVIALAELIGMPRASYAASTFCNQAELNTSSEISQSGRKNKAMELWYSICTIERMACLMYNLPIGTSSYDLPKQPITFRGGKMPFKAYVMRMADAISGIQSLDNMRDDPALESAALEKTLKIDSELRTLANAAPKEWWTMKDGEPSADQILQYMTKYFTVRTHLWLAMRADARERYPYSYSVCAEACQELSIRYVKLRTSLPNGFFMSRVLDLQVLTGMVFILSQTVSRSSMSPVDQDLRDTDSIAEQVLDTMDSVSQESNGDFAKQGAVALRSLRTLLSSPGSSSDGLQSLTLSIPLLGKIHVRRKTLAPISYNSRPVASEDNQHPIEDGMQWDQALNSLNYNLSSDDTAWLMQFSTNIPFLGDDYSLMDQWNDLEEPNLLISKLPNRQE